MTTAAPAQGSTKDHHEIDLAIGGMTCASCSSRVERKLNKLDGVAATVNLATEKAHIRFHDPVRPEDLVAVVERTGYSATPLSDSSPAASSAAAPLPADPPSADTTSAGTPAADAAPTPSADSGRSEETSRSEESAPSEETSPADEATASQLSAAVTAPTPSSDDGAPPRTAARPAATGTRSVSARLGAADLRSRLVVAAALTVPIVLVAMTPLGHALGAARPWLELLLATPVAIWGAWPFHRAAWLNARHLSSTMDTLVSLGVTAAYGFSLVATLAGQTGHLYYETAAVITTFLLAGRVAEARARREGRSALQSLLDLSRGEVEIVTRGAGGTTHHERIDIDALAVGMEFLVRPGEKVATDGVIVEGTSAVDASLVTGESLPVDVVAGDRVVGGTINTTGLLLVRAQAVGADTTLAGITRLVEAAQTGKAPVQRLADRVSAVFVPVVLVIAALTLVGWLLTGHALTAALSASVAVLVVACPCALGLATPTALLAGTGRGAQLGILIKGPEILESTRRVDTVLLDKTGTVTSGRMRLVGIDPAGRLTSTAALQAAAAVELGSEHPVALAIVAAARERGLAIPRATDTTALPGSGVRATIKDTTVTVGRADLFEHVPAEIAREDPAGTTVYVGWGGRARAALTVADGVRPDSAQGLARLHELGLSTYLLTGDSASTAARVAQEVGIAPSRVISGVRPQDKYAVVEQLKGEGHVVAMVGDGVNDAAALAAADLGIAMGGGTDIAMESADIVLMRPQIAAVADAIHLSRRTLRICLENLAWAFSYNLIAIPLAVFGLINPMIAGAAMAASSVIVVCNSLRLRRVGRAPGDDPWDEAAVAALQGEVPPRDAPTA